MVPLPNTLSPPTPQFGVPVASSLDHTNHGQPSPLPALTPTPPPMSLTTPPSFNLPQSSTSFNVEPHGLTLSTVATPSSSIPSGQSYSTADASATVSSYVTSSAPVTPGDVSLLPQIVQKGGKGHAKCNTTNV
ncbi:hypothetical protein PAXINDRAFT_14943 [Paxillus involutus ATCC 200175]|uniref:Uncharacterized protein n=1 Tax=Paxillus involutus ATCC 200175 TaxID=664439 RepID=A0A0C9STM7_PAXIN|nr:hypothetical protein PAXINDRAFT_14943 [Paxillus involutus ATCC 200175]